MQLDEVTIPVRVKVQGAFAWLGLLGLWALALSLVLAATCCAPTGIKAPTEHDQMSRAVRLRTACGNFSDVFGYWYAVSPPSLRASMQYGSGVIVGPHEILTAAHVPTCTKGTPIVFAKLGDTWHQVGLARSYMPNRDIAMMYITADTGFSPVAFRSNVLDSESVCAAIPYPIAHYDCGTFKGYDWLTNGVNARLALAVVHGNSGSGIFDREGRLVGLVTAVALCHDVLTFTFNAETGAVEWHNEPTSGDDCDGMASMLDGVVTP